MQHSAQDRTCGGEEPWWGDEGAREKELETVRHGERALNDVALTRAKKHNRCLFRTDRPPQPKQGVSRRRKYSHLNPFPHRRMCKEPPRGITSSISWHRLPDTYSIQISEERADKGTEVAWHSVAWLSELIEAYDIQKRG